MARSPLYLIANTIKCIPMARTYCTELYCYLTISPSVYIKIRHKNIEENFCWLKSWVTSNMTEMFWRLNYNVAQCIEVVEWRERMRKEKMGGWHQRVDRMSAVVRDGGWHQRVDRMSAVVRDGGWHQRVDRMSAVVRDGGWHQRVDRMSAVVRDGGWHQRVDRMSAVVRDGGRLSPMSAVVPTTQVVPVSRFECSLA